MNHCTPLQDSVGCQNGFDNTDTIPVDGTFANGVLGSTSPDFSPSIEVSPVNTLESRHAHSTNGLDEGGDDEEGCGSLTPSLPMIGSTLTPGRKSMEALKKVMKKLCGVADIEYRLFMLSWERVN